MSMTMTMTQWQWQWQWQWQKILLIQKKIINTATEIEYTLFKCIRENRPWDYKVMETDLKNLNYLKLTKKIYTKKE